MAHHATPLDPAKGGGGLSPRAIVSALFNNRVHVFAVPAIVTLFWNVALQFDPPLAYYAMVTLFTMASYINNMVTDAEEDAVNYPSEGRLFTPGSRLTLAIIPICLAISCVIAMSAGWRFIVYATIVNFMGFLYGAPITIRLRDRRVQFRIKAVLVLKNAYSAVFWSLLLLVTPYIFMDKPLAPALYFAVFVNFLVAFSIELLWDVRDCEGDRVAGITTLPIRFGLPVAHRILLALNFCAAAALLAGFALKLVPAAYLLLLLHFAASVPFFRWYFGLKNHQLGSHLYLMILAVPLLTVIGLANI